MSEFDGIEVFKGQTRQIRGISALAALQGSTPMLGNLPGRPAFTMPRSAASGEKLLPCEETTLTTAEGAASRDG